MATPATLMSNPGLLKGTTDIKTLFMFSGADDEQPAAADLSLAELDAMTDPALHHRLGGVDIVRLPVNADYPRRPKEDAGGSQQICRLPILARP